MHAVLDFDFVAAFLVAAAVSDDALILLVLSFFPAALTLVVPLFSFARDEDVLELLFMMMRRYKYRYLLTTVASY